MTDDPPPDAQLDTIAAASPEQAFSYVAEMSAELRNIVANQGSRGRSIARLLDKARAAAEAEARRGSAGRVPRVALRVLDG